MVDLIDKQQVKPPSQQQADLALESICQLGCAAVYRIIRQMENGAELPELSSVSMEVKVLILTELKAIMAIYDAREGGGAVCQLPKSSSKSTA